MKSFLAALLILQTLEGCVATRHEAYEAHPEQSAQAFELLKSLAGKWHGTLTNGSNQAPVDLTYEVVSAGTAVMERLHPGTEHEMITMYHRDGPKLLMTHYCSQGNQPRMELRGFNPGKETWLSFEYRAATNLSSPKELVMHDLRLCLTDKDHLLANWTAFVDGKSNHTANFDFQRLP